MIKYALKCTDGHVFESWFADAAAYDTLAARGLVTCAVCGTADVSKSLMAPRVRPARRAAAIQAQVDDGAAEAPDAPAPAVPEGPALALTEVEKKVAELRAKVEATSTYVGGAFAKEARAMHEGEKDAAPIWGETTPAEAKALAEDGIPALPLPFGPKAKAN